MSKKSQSWSKTPFYESPSRTKIRELFGDDIVVVPGGATLEDIINSLDNHWHNGETLDLKNCTFLPEHPGEVIFFKEGKLPSATELINLATQAQFKKYYARVWGIHDEDFNGANSNFLKDVYRNSINKRYHDHLLEANERLFFDGVRQHNTDEDIWNVWSYMALIKGGAMFYTAHSKGEHLEIENCGNGCWSVEVPSDSDPNKTYETIISFSETEKNTLGRVLRTYTGECTCPDYQTRKKEGFNPICKHQVYALAELACTKNDKGEWLDIQEILPFPTYRAFKLHEKIDHILYPQNRRPTDTDKEFLIHAYMYIHQLDPTQLFKTTPNYIREKHEETRASAFKPIHI